MNAKQRWKSKHCTQVNVALPKELAAAFKARCGAAGISVAGEVARLMAESLGMPPPAKKKAVPAAPKFDTRLARRKAVKSALWLLGEVRAAEEAYMDRIPEQLQESNGAGIDDAISALGEAMDGLCGIEIYPEPPARRKPAQAAACLGAGSHTGGMRLRAAGFGGAQGKRGRPECT
jgi:hypothetical protein